MKKELNNQLIIVLKGNKIVKTCSKKLSECNYDDILKFIEINIKFKESDYFNNLNDILFD